MLRWLLAVSFFIGQSAALLSAEDVIFLRGADQPIRCEIEAITDKVVMCRMTVDLGGGRMASSKRTLPTEKVDYIEFAPLPGEAEILENPENASLEALEKMWNEKLRLLHRPRSNAGVIGVAFGKALLKSNDEYQWKRAMGVFEKIRTLGWSAGNHAEARKGGLRAMIRLGDLEEALAEAKKLAAETEDAELLIEARYAQARVEFEKLEALVEENPRWEEDDAVRPERNRLYHETVDRFLWPYLFHGTREEEAARGLVAAAEVYKFGGETESAKACLADVVALYPETESSGTARKRLAQINENSLNHENEKPKQSN